MPPILIWAAGAIGIVVAAKWIARESRRINAELHPERYGAAEATTADPAPRLRRHADGIYRPE